MAKQPMSLTLSAGEIGKSTVQIWYSDFYGFREYYDVKEIAKKSYDLVYQCSRMFTIFPDWIPPTLLKIPALCCVSDAVETCYIPLSQTTVGKHRVVQAIPIVSSDVEDESDDDDEYHPVASSDDDDEDAPKYKFNLVSARQTIGHRGLEEALAKMPKFDQDQCDYLESITTRNPIGKAIVDSQAKKPDVQPAKKRKQGAR